MKLESHCQKTIELFYAPFPEIHKWLDEFAGKPGIGMRHRKFRHHLKGIEEAKKLFGDIGAEVARQHIIDDLGDEGWKESDGFPKDKKDYVRMGLF